MSVMFGALHLSHLNLQKPETVTTTVTKESSLSGKVVENKVTEKPFVAEFSVQADSQDDLVFSNIVGLRPSDKPERPVKVKLTTNKEGQLQLSTSYQYTEIYNDHEEIQVKSNKIEAGEEIAPYSYASESYWEYETQKIPVTRQRTQTVSEDKTIDSQPVFNDLYAFLSELKESDTTITPVLAQVTQAGQTFLQEAKEALVANLTARQEALQRQIEALGQRIRRS